MRNNSARHVENDKINGAEFTEGPKDEQEIYEGCRFLNISVDELEHNKVAIKQLLNSYNIVEHNLTRLKDENKNKDITISLLKVTPFIAIFGLIINVIGTVVLSIGVNIVTGNQVNNLIGISLIILGGISLLSGNIIPILYPWYSKKIK
ncbi:MAG: hypothetical protein LBS86_06270 [Treponema sp.]|jgi:hypothetical protein|nr:hypothetical protein [Treponema sp.]